MMALLTAVHCTVALTPKRIASGRHLPAIYALFSLYEPKAGFAWGRLKIHLTSFDYRGRHARIHSVLHKWTVG